ncbi:hypothetical protein OPT61_g5396 [Boeremia exigua]|uniref:Uncharacterized protein n=1 Tax=Boeremia exigua TaxID=749465 RepID=A0ACC2IAS3_9PLEO|nr:hypothetical protein OPT61_g5396 [Boeremia exigua]
MGTARWITASSGMQDTENSWLRLDSPCLYAINTRAARLTSGTERPAEATGGAASMGATIVGTDRGYSRLLSRRGRCYCVTHSGAIHLASPALQLRSDACGQGARASPLHAFQKAGRGGVLLVSAWRPAAMARSHALMANPRFCILTPRTTHARPVRQKPEKARRGTSMTAFGSSPTTRPPTSCALPRAQQRLTMFCRGCRALQRLTYRHTRTSCKVIDVRTVV